MAEQAEQPENIDRVRWFSHKFEKEKLKPGHHIYCHRKGGYSHHGIYVGDDKVIHFCGTDGNGALRQKNTCRQSNETMERAISLLQAFVAIGDYSQEAADSLQEELAEIQENHERPVCIKLATLDEFLDGSKLRLVSYNCSTFKKALTLVSSSCHTIKELSPLFTVRLAKFFCNNPALWPNYHLVKNNCETFACYCKTGLLDIASQLNQIRRNVISEMNKKGCETIEEALNSLCEKWPKGK